MAVLMAIAASTSRAEQSVGLEAEGVDPSAALHNTLGLDVRDANGRPVRREVIERQLQETGMKAAESSSLFSGLPKLKAMLRLLAAAAPLQAWFGAARHGFTRRAVFGLAPTRRAEKSLALPLLSMGFSLIAGAVFLRPHARSRSTATAAPVPLRC